MNLNNELINMLLNSTKEIVQPPGKPKLERGHYRIGFELQSIDKSFFFSAFGRYNAMFQENFSIGLIYIPKDEKGTHEILRCNGQHGEHKMFPHHTYFHIHRASEDAIEQGLNEDCCIEITDKYATFEEALRYFVKLVNLRSEDIKKYFPGKDLQLDIFKN